MVSRDKEYKKGIEKLNEIIRFFKEEKQTSNELLDKKFKEGRKLVRYLRNLVNEEEFKIEFIRR